MQKGANSNFKGCSKMQGGCVIGIYGAIQYIRIKLKLVCDELLITEMMSYCIYMAYFDLSDKYTSIIV